MKQLLVGVILLQIFFASVKSQIIQGHLLQKESVQLILYGDAHKAKKNNEKQNKYLKDKILPKTNNPIIAEMPFFVDAIPIIGDFIDGNAALSESQLSYLKIKATNPFYRNINSTDNRTFIKTVIEIKKELESKKDRNIKNNDLKIQVQKLLNLFIEILEILQTLEIEYKEKLHTFDLSNEEQKILMKNLDETKMAIENSINQWIEELKENYNLKILNNINNKIIPETIKILDFKFILEILSLIKQQKNKIIIFIGYNHTKNLVKIFKSIGFSEEKTIKAIRENGIEPEYFDWIL